MEYKYLFGEFGSPARSSDNKLRIMKIDLALLNEFKPTDLEIYNSLSEIMKNNKVFNSLSKKRKVDILKEENIELIKGFIAENITGNECNNMPEFLQHTLFGDIYNQKILGVHHRLDLSKGFSEIEKILTPPDKNGVYEVEIKRKDGRLQTNINVKKWRKKKTTFFPDLWDLKSLYIECSFAFSNKTLEKTDNNKFWSSKTYSGIPVEIYTNENDSLLTIYPIYLGKFTPNTSPL